jgi:hypothetical protein
VQADGLTSRYCGRNVPLTEMLTGFGLELAGRAGARLGIVVHSSTILLLLAGLPVRQAVKNPVGNQELDVDARTRNALLRDLRCRGDQGSPCAPSAGRPPAHHRRPGRITQITRAAFVLTQFEHKYIS